jgi:hypothetical protein
MRFASRLATSMVAASILGIISSAALAADVQAVASAGPASAGNNADADLLVLVTDSSTGAAITSLTKSDFTVVDQFGLPGQLCGFSNNVTSFNNVGTGAYQLGIATHSTHPPASGCKWIKGDYLGQVIVKSGSTQGQAAFSLNIP